MNKLYLLSGQGDLIRFKLWYLYIISLFEAPLFPILELS